MRILSTLKSFLPQPYHRDARFYTRLSVEECLARITRNTTREGWGAFLDRRDLIATVSGTAFRLRENQRTRNSWRVTFSGTLVPESKGTRIEGQLDTFRWVEPFMSCWLIFVILPGLLVAFAGAAYLVRTAAHVLGTSRLPDHLVPDCLNSIPRCLIPLVMVLFGRVMQLAGRMSAVKDGEYLVHAIEKLFDATETTSDANQGSGYQIDPSI